MFHPLTLLLLLSFLPVFSRAQGGYTPVLSPRIHTLQLSVNGDAASLPLIDLDGRDKLTVEFDDVGHEYRRFTYRIQHCDYLGRPSKELFSTDFMQATAEEEVIDDYATSLNTSVQYTHYRFSLPNANLRPLISGNYRLSIFVEDEEGEGVEVVRTHFAVADRRVGINAQCSPDTDIDYHNAHQQLSIKVNMGDLALREADKEVKLVVMQNRRYHEAVIAPKATAQNGTQILWEHARELIFPAGNEFRKMEMLSTRYPGMHGVSMQWFEPYFHYTLADDAPRRNYLYDEDQDGLSVIRCADSSDPATEADYVLTHFSLLSPVLSEGEMYVSGHWAQPAFDPRYRMAYNAEREAYEAAILLKKGYYNYEYVALRGKGANETVEPEGNFFQTENEYTILVYYHPTGARYDQLVGVATPIYKAK